MGKARTEDVPPAQAQPAPPLLMCTVRDDAQEMRIGPTLTESMLKVKLRDTSESAIDAVLRENGFRRTYAWRRDRKGAWTLVAKVTEDEGEGEGPNPSAN